MQVKLPLNCTRVVFLHQEETGLDAPRAVQIDIKAKGYAREDGIEATYTTYEDEISELILKLVVAHIREPLPERFIVDEDEYTIVAARRPWRYGKKKILLTWGEDRILPCEDKWCFTFVMRTVEDV